MQRDERVPVQVLLGLTDFIIKGPFKSLPKKKADVSFINDNNNIRKNKFLS